MQTPKLERAYRTFVRCRHVIHESSSEAELLQAICETAVTELGFRLAWIGLITPDDPLVHPAAQAGYEQGYLTAVSITWADNELGHGPTGRAIRECRVAVAQDIATDERYAPWRADALRRGYASSAALPLHDGTNCIGALNLYAVEPDAFDDDELALLEEVAMDLVLGIQHLRMRKSIEAVAEQLDRAMGVEAAAVAATALVHDFNNMLHVVSGSIDLARLAETEDERNQALDDAKAAIETMGALGWQLLSLTRRAAGQNNWTQIDQVVQGMVSLLGRLARRATIAFELATTGVRVPIASLDLERTLINLVINAEQAMPGGGRLSITSELRELANETWTRSGPLEPGTYAVLSVEDEGEGISPEALPHIFEPLFTTKAEKGTGLGLPAVLGIALPIGGAVDVQSHPGEGTRVSVFLPARAAEPPHLATEV